MIERFKAILLKPCQDHELGTIVEVAAGASEYAGRWLVLLPTDIAGAWLVPFIDADRAITTREAAHVLSTRRGRFVGANNVRRYVKKGKIAPSGWIPGTQGVRRLGLLMVSREAVWKMPLPKARKRPKPQKQEDNSETEAAE